MHRTRSHHRLSRGSLGSAVPAMLAFFLGLASGEVAVAASGAGASGRGAEVPAGNGAAIIEAARLQGDIYLLMMSADDAARGNFDAYAELRELTQAIGKRIDILRNGDNALGVRRAGEQQNLLLEHLERRWHSVDGAAQRMLSRQPLMLDLMDSAAAFGAMTPQLQARLDEVARLLMEAEAPAQQQYMVMRNLLLVDRLLRSLREILEGGHGAVVSADRFSRDASMLGRTIDALLNGSEDLGISRIENAKAHAALREVSTVFSEFTREADSILSASTDAFEVRESAHMIRYEGTELARDALALAQSY